MAIHFDERPKSRKSSENPLTVTYLYVLDGIFDHAAARAYAIAATPVVRAHPSGALIYRSNVELDPQGYQTWHVSVPYVTADDRRRDWQPYEYRWTFDTTGGSARITSALEHIQSYAPAGATAPDHKGAIGVTASGVEGTEIVVPQFKWTETHQLPAVFATFAYSDTVEALTGKVNAATFRGKPAGSVRFDGAAGGGSSKNPNLVEITYHFVRGVAISNQSYGDITGVDKAAWEYLWIEYQTEEDSTANRAVERPLAAHVERVYDSGDFSLLGIGTT